MVWIFVLLFPVRPFSGLIREAGSNPIFILICLSRLASAHFWDCLLLQGAFAKPRHFGKILRNPLCYCGSPFWLSFSKVFLRKLWSFWRIISRFPRKLVVYSAGYSWSCPLLSPRCWSSRRLSGSVSIGSCLSLSFLWLQGLQSSQMDWFAIVSDVLGILLPVF